jgi:predicted nuclease with TOPRIM domain
MSDFEKLKKLLEDVTEMRKSTENFVKRANEYYEIFVQMDSDCDIELDEIDAEMEQLQEDLEDEEVSSEDIEQEIKELRTDRELVVEAADLLDRLKTEFEALNDKIDELEID